MNVGERIKQRRIELNMTQDELAKKVGYKSRSSINKIELSRDLPLPKVQKVAKVLECSPSYLIGWKEEYTIEEAESDAELSDIPEKIKDYALKLNALPKTKQEQIMSLIDMLSEK